MLDPNEYTVGWICAISTEFNAAKAFLDEKHDGQPPVSQHDCNSYALGTMGDHNIVIAVLPDGEYGTTSAAAVARDMLHSFPNVRIGLMVGIAGGAPSSKHDVRLGDIVVSRRNGGKGGVFQYDYGKAVQNPAVSFEHTDFLDQPPMLLRAAVSSLRSKYEMEGHHLKADVEKALGRWPRLRKTYSRPPADSDKLYRSDIIHPNSSEGCHSVCGDDTALLIERPKRTDDEDDPAIHYGLMASANRLMKDSTLRDKLTTENGVLCFEMEAAGLMNHFPCLVIRGICDYSDSHKNKEWQGFAAMMAAAYAKDLLHQIPPNKVEAERRIGDVLGTIKDDLDHMQQTTNEINATTVKLKHDQHITRLHKWLSPPDSSTNFNHARQKCHKGSGLWFISSSIYKDWKQGLRRHLWLHGLAGCGKTVLSTTIVDDLRKANDAITLEFYFDFSDNTKQGLDGVLRSLIFQLYNLGHNTEELGSLYDTLLQGQKQPDTKALTNCFSAIIKGTKTIYIVLDALDESTDREQLLDWMKDIFTLPDLSHIFLIATSRPEEAFLKRLPCWVGEENCFSLDKTAINTDIYAYVVAQLKQRPAFVDKNLSDDLGAQIRDKVGNGADGMFRWAACQLDSLSACQSPQDIEDTLKYLPEDLNRTYQRMIDCIPPSQKSKAVRLLHFMVHADTPLTVSEAIDVIATQADEGPQGFNIKARPFQGASILHYCPGLVSIVEVSKLGSYNLVTEVHLSHFSVKEYLLQEDRFDLMRSSIVITQTFLTYLADSKSGLYYTADRCFPLAKRAANTFMKYAALSETSNDIVSAILVFLEDEASFQWWVSLIETGQYNPGVILTTRLCSTCYGGMLRVSESLIQKGVDVNQQPKEGIPTALYAASQEGHFDIAQLLLDKGADVNSQGNGSHGTALYAASKNGHLEIVRLLIDRGANIDMQDQRAHKALYAASRYGHLQTVQLLLDRGANVNVQDQWACTALYAASKNGHSQTIQLLLDRGANIDIKNRRGDCGIYAASQNGHSQTAQLLLDRGANIDMQDQMAHRAIYAASRYGYLQAVQLLLERGASIDMQDHWASEALFTAAENGNLEIVRLLLERGASTDMQDHWASEALFTAAENGNLEIVRLLIDRGANIDMQDQRAHKALYAASRYGHLQTVQLLLDRGANIDMQDQWARTSLYAASKNGHLEIVRLLLDRGADVGLQSSYWSHVLNAASIYGHSDVFQLLTERFAAKQVGQGTQGEQDRQAKRARCE
ncbi:uncharacterized protein CTRU02_207096 [Colletotrichum truncatum]|uniref:Uncharacterized protein n=1 Tax=Colletotrichum truncatum TaxID=5467 RepID=A0ACC3YZV8_COLTU